MAGGGGRFRQGPAGGGEPLLLATAQGRAGLLQHQLEPFQPGGIKLLQGSAQLDRQVPIAGPPFDQGQGAGALGREPVEQRHQLAGKQFGKSRAKAR